MSLAQVFGQLRALEATPRRIKPLLAEPGVKWYLKSLAFPHSVRAELDRLKQRHLSFSQIFAFYKLHAASSDTSSLAARSKNAQDLLRKKAWLVPMPVGANRPKHGGVMLDHGARG